MSPAEKLRNLKHSARWERKDLSTMRRKKRLASLEGFSLSAVPWVGYQGSGKGASANLFPKPPLLILISFLEVLWWSSVPCSDRSVRWQKLSGESKCVFPQFFNFTPWSGLIIIIKSNKMLYRVKMRDKSGLWFVDLTAVRSRSILEHFVESRNTSELAEALPSFSKL